MKNDQEAGSAGRGKKKREPKDFKKGFIESQHKSTAGWHGIPVIALRSAKGRSRRGEARWNAKLTWEKARTIRRLYGRGGWT